jgi:dTDP-4-dehydrorhamnose 3,5-epimerase
VKFEPTPLAGLTVVHASAFQDGRGSFRRLQCAREFAAAGLADVFVQTNLSTNNQRHILRGLHYQQSPHQEDKLVRCVAGRILDVAVDVRPGSSTFGKHFSIELDADNGLALYLPKGFAHGYLTLTEHSAVLYHVSEYYTPAAERGLRWNDPCLGIAWPAAAPLLSPKDADWPDFGAPV